METIRSVRERQGLRRMDLAVRIGVDIATVYRWESGRTKPSIWLARAIAEALGVSMGDIDWERPSNEYKERRAS